MGFDITVCVPSSIEAKGSMTCCLFYIVQASWFEGVVKCYTADSLKVVIDKIVKAEVHRLVIVDDGDHVVGIVSLSDILNYLILKPMGNGE